MGTELQMTLCRKCIYDHDVITDAEDVIIKNHLPLIIAATNVEEEQRKHLYKYVLSQEQLGERQVQILWMMKLVKRMNYSLYTLMYAVALMDNCLQRGIMRCQTVTFQTLSYCCLDIASCYSEDGRRLKEGTTDICVIDTEATMLKILCVMNGQTRAGTVFNFFNMYCYCDPIRVIMHDVALFILNIVSLHIPLYTYPSSHLAAAVYYVTMLCFDVHMDDQWGLQLQSCSGLKVEDFEHVVQHIYKMCQSLVCTAPQETRLLFGYLDRFARKLINEVLPYIN